MQKDFASDWQHQKQVYNGIIRQCNSLAPGTFVLVSGLERLDPLKGLYFIWRPAAISAALGMLYSENNLLAGESIGGNILFNRYRQPGSPAAWAQPVFRHDFFNPYFYYKGHLPEYTYDKLLIFNYDRSTGEVTRVNQYLATMPDGTSIEILPNWDNCLSCAAKDTPERSFVLGLLESKN